MRKARPYFKMPCSQKCALESNKDLETLEYQRDDGNDLVSEIREAIGQGKDFFISAEWD